MKIKFFCCFLLLVSACTWNPKVFHPGLGNTGQRVCTQGQFEMGVQTYVLAPAFVRAAYALLDRLNLSIGGGMTGHDIMGAQLAINWLAIDGKKAYLTLSPNVVTYKHDDSFSGVTLSMGISPGIKISRVFSLYLNFYLGRFYGSHYSSGDAGEGDIFNAGIGFGFDFGKVRLNADFNAPDKTRFGDTGFLPFFGLGLYFDL